MLKRPRVLGALAVAAAVFITTFIIDVQPAAASSDAHGCSSGYLCNWKDSYYSGERTNFYYCRTETLANDLWAGHSDYMKDAISSISDNQSAGTWTTFWDYNYNHYLNQNAPGWRDNLVYDAVYDQVNGSPGSWNDRIEYVSVC